MKKTTQRKGKKKTPIVYFPVSVDVAVDIVDHCEKITGYLQDALQEYSEQVNAKDGQVVK